MAREFRILHHRHAPTGGHWDLVENPLPHRAATTTAPHGEGTLCGALAALAEEGWTPLMPLMAQAQVGESFLLLARG
jgi:hypothetical protein